MAPFRSYYRSRLYRKSRRTVILALIFLVLFASAFAQFAKQRKPDPGPRAVGLLKIAADGGAQLVPVTMMVGGKFYDAGTYKADPVPMALQPETVYEAVQSGVSQGLFTVGGSARGPEGWFAGGKWRSSAQLEAEKAKAKTDAEKRAQKSPLPEDQIGGPPRLKKSQSPDTSPQSSSPPQPAAPSPKVAAPASSSSSPPASTASPKEDPNRPILRRVAPTGEIHEQTKADIKPLQGPFHFIAAVSDAGGPDPRPYSYQMKPAEDAAFLKNMLAMASEEVTSRAQTSKNAVEPKSRAPDKHAHASPAPQFQDVQMHVFDLTSSNEPVLVMTANAKLASAPDVDFILALVARQDIYGDLHKVFARTTDTQHLDALPKFEFVDAVDADGDGRGELLFRMTSDSGSAFAIYTVIGDKLWPLFEGKPGT